MMKQFCLDCKNELTEKNKKYIRRIPKCSRYKRCNKCVYARYYKMALDNGGRGEYNRRCREAKKKRKERGVCVQCKENMMDNNSVYCRKHYILKQIYQHKLQISYEGFEELLKKDGGKCPYTGLDLILGKNTSIDHVIPLGKGGSNSMDNIVICHVDFNRIKLDHSLDYLYNICSLFIEKYKKDNNI